MTLVDLENELNGFWRDGLGEGIVRELRIDIYTLSSIKWITNKDVLYRQGTLLNVLWQPGWEGSLGERGYRDMDG